MVKHGFEAIDVHGGAAAHAKHEGSGVGAGEHHMNFVTHSIEVCQRLMTRSVIICFKLWVEAVSCTT